MKIRKVAENEFLKVHNFVSRCNTLENYPRHLYRIILRYFSDSCFIAEKENRIVGFVMGFIPSYPKNTYFLWQIGIRPDMQGQGLGTKLLKSVQKKLKNLGCKRIELTIDPENTASRKLFKKMGYKNISRQETPAIKLNDSYALKDFYGQGRHFMLFSKSLTFSSSEKH